MIKRSDKRRKKRKPPEGSSRAKGDIVEKIVAAMHEHPNIQVETNVFLHSQDGERTREIDVLLSSQVVGYPVHFAFECKNETKPTGLDKIDEFIGKLKDVGIPTHQGIFVSASRFTKPAISRAQDAGLTALLLKDTTEKLPNFLRHAFQSIIFFVGQYYPYQDNKQPWWSGILGRHPFFPRPGWGGLWLCYGFSVVEVEIG